MSQPQPQRETVEMVRCPYREDVEASQECGDLFEDMDALMDHLSDDHDPLAPIIERAEWVQVAGGDSA